MIIHHRSQNKARLNISLKRILLEMNRDLDTVIEKIDRNNESALAFGHSIYAKSSQLTHLEVFILFLEDRRFFLHHGFEFRALLRSAKRLLMRRRLGGISTIDQQVVRIVTERRERTLRRKFRETILAYLINFHQPKRLVLDFYIHNAYLGYGIEGVEVAANRIFRTSAADLTVEQSAFVASLFPYPIPRQVLESLAVLHSFGKDATPDEIIRHSEGIAPRWSVRVFDRYKYALENRDFTPKSR